MLIIEQMREVHAEIPEIIRRIEHGDGVFEFDPTKQPMGMGGMGGMGGGMEGMGGGTGGKFGGGFF